MLLLIQYTLIFASVLLLVALGGCFSEHSGVINLGLEGIMVIGALGGALMMRYLPSTLPAFVMIVCVLLGAVVFGVVYSSLLGVACINFKADQTIVGTALNMLGVAAATPSRFSAVPTMVWSALKLMQATPSSAAYATPNTIAPSSTQRIIGNAAMEPGR